MVSSWACLEVQPWRPHMGCPSMLSVPAANGRCACKQETASALPDAGDVVCFESLPKGFISLLICVVSGDGFALAQM